MDRSIIRREGSETERSSVDWVNVTTFRGPASTVQLLLDMSLFMVHA